MNIISVPGSKRKKSIHLEKDDIIYVYFKGNVVALEISVKNGALNSRSILKGYGDCRKSDLFKNNKIVNDELE